MQYLAAFLIIALITGMLQRCESLLRRRVVKSNHANDLVLHWLQEREIFYRFDLDRSSRTYHFNYDLHTCLVRVETIVELSGRRCLMKVVLPVVVQPNRISEIERVLQALNKRCKPLRFRLVRSSGLIYLNSDYFKISRDNDPYITLSMDFLHVLSVANACFPEINRAINGGGTPELFSIRVFGEEDYRLN